MLRAVSVSADGGAEQISRKMYVHDYHLKKYIVDASSSAIAMYLHRPDQSGIPEKVIRFAGVAGYDFSDALGAIIFDLTEQDMATFLLEKRSDFEKSYRRIGCPRFWAENTEEASARLKSFRVWEITSSIGFEGWVVAKSVEEVLL